MGRWMNREVQQVDRKKERETMEQPGEDIKLVETQRMTCRLVRKPVGFDLVHELRFPLHQGDVRSIIFFLEKVKADQHMPYNYMHGNLFLSYAPEESSNEVTLQYEDRRMYLDLPAALLLLERLQEHSGP
jgi:hypothetical protein